MERGVRGMEVAIGIGEDGSGGEEDSRSAVGKGDYAARSFGSKLRGPVAEDKEVGDEVE